jgi:hypothetical protein
MMDANEALSDNKHLLHFMATNNQVSLIQPTSQAPATYNRGVKCIDYILGSQHILPFVTASGYLPFYEGGWPTSDHRALFVDINHVSLFGAITNAISQPIPRLLTSKCRPSVQKFIQLLAESHVLPSLLNRLKDLEAIHTWDDTDHQELESIDVKFTEVLLAAEAKVATPACPWSPTLDRAFKIFSYWCIKRSADQNDRDASLQLNDIVQKLPPDAVFQNNHRRSTRGQKRLAKKHLTTVRRDATREPIGMRKWGTPPKQRQFSKSVIKNIDRKVGIL